MMNSFPLLAARLPETHALLAASGLSLHPAVSRVVLHGSRGLKGGARPDSDIDLSLIVDTADDLSESQLERRLREALITTLDSWRSPVGADLAAVFDTQRCGLQCFERTYFDAGLCPERGRDCFGLYKVQQRFSGFVIEAGIEVRRMYPCLTIWKRIERAAGDLDSCISGGEPRRGP